jgi:hypothetical protein
MASEASVQHLIATGRAIADRRLQNLRTAQACTAQPSIAPPVGIA